MNEEIIRLQRLKRKLTKKLLQLEEELKKKKDKDNQMAINLNTSLISLAPTDYKHPDTSSTTYQKKLCKLSGDVLGIYFEDVSRKWLRDDVYLYTAKVVTKTLSFDLELTVTLKDSDDFTIDDITYHFIGIKTCYLPEISPWFQEIASTKNFSILMSALSDYNDKNIFRFKILDKLALKEYVTAEQDTEGGGVIAHIHSPMDINMIYAILHWTIRFVHKTWCTEHFFTLQPVVDTGVEFSEQNDILLKEFCEKQSTTKELLDLWIRLCTAVDAYHAKETNDVE